MFWYLCGIAEFQNLYGIFEFCLVVYMELKSLFSIIWRNEEKQEICVCVLNDPGPPVAVTYLKIVLFCRYLKRGHTDVRTSSVNIVLTMTVGWPCGSEIASEHLIIDSIKTCTFIPTEQILENCKDYKTSILYQTARRQ